jgi:hypothetical protein
VAGMNKRWILRGAFLVVLVVGALMLMIGPVMAVPRPGRWGESTPRPGLGPAGSSAGPSAIRCFLLDLFSRSQAMAFPMASVALVASLGHEHQRHLVVAAPCSMSVLPVWAKQAKTGGRDGTTARQKRRSGDRKGLEGRPHCLRTAGVVGSSPITSTIHLGGRIR